MINLLKSIVETITSVISYFISTIESLINILGRLPTFISYITNIINMLPDLFKVFLAVSISVLVIQYILGRNG